MRYALSGCGYFGQAIAETLATIEGATLVACHSPGDGAVRLAERLKIQAYTSYEAMLDAGGIDAVLIAGPNHSHAEQFLAAAKAGFPIFVEKPFALHPKDARAMLDVAESSKIRFMVGHILHFYPQIQRAKKSARSLGLPLALEGSRASLVKTGAPSWKQDQRFSGGQLFHHIHEIDLALSFLGPVAEVFCMASRHGTKQKEESSLFVSLRHKNGALSSLHYANRFHLPSHALRFHFAKGSLLLDFHKDRFLEEAEGVRKEAALYPEGSRDAQSYLGRGGASGFGRKGEQLPQYLALALEEELRAFHHHLQGGACPPELRPLCDGAQAFHAVAVAHAALQSAQDGRVHRPEERS